MHPRSHDVYFTDTLYGHLQDFRPAPGLRNQVYRWVEATGALTVVADGFTLPNGITFSPNGKHAYVSDTGMHHAFYGFNYSDPATMYVGGGQKGEDVVTTFQCRTNQPQLPFRRPRRRHL